MVTRSGDSVVYMPTVTEPEPLLDHQGGVLPHNRWQRSQLFGSIVGFHPLTLLDRKLEAKTRIAQCSWARPGGLELRHVGLPKCTRFFTGFCEDFWKDFSDASGFLQFRMFRIVCSK